MCGAFFCLVVGSRGFDDYELMCAKMDTILSRQDKVVIVSGGAKGADSLAERYARDRGYGLAVFPADWKRYGKRAGYIRNCEMHEYMANFTRRGAVAFWDGESRGTKQNFELCVRYRTPLRKILY